MNNKYSIPLKSILCLIYISFLACENIEIKGSNENSNRIALKNSNIKVTILKNAGGRVVSLKRPNGKNILKSDSLLWNYKFVKPIKERLNQKHIQFNGHIVWLGPQSGWWTQQNIKSGLKERKAIWPPDPFLIYSENKVLEKNENSVTLLSPKSIYSKIQMKKKITLLNDSKVIYAAEVKNISKENVAWDIWFNTRLEGYNSCYIPVGKNEYRVDSRTNAVRDTIEHEIIDGYFTYNPTKPSDNKRRISKAFINPSKNFIAAFTKNEMLIIWITIHDKDEIHPNHGLVEIYNAIEPDGKEALLELEYHTPYKKLLPGESMNGNEMWEVVEYNGAGSQEEQLSFLNSIIEE